MRRVGIKRNSSVEIGSWDMPPSKRPRVDEGPRRGGALWSRLTATLGGIVSVVRGWFHRSPGTMSHSHQKNESPNLPSPPHSPPPSTSHSPSPLYSPSPQPSTSSHFPKTWSQLPAHHSTSPVTRYNTSQTSPQPVASRTIHQSTARTTGNLWNKAVTGKVSILHQQDMDKPSHSSTSTATRSHLAPLYWTAAEPSPPPASFDTSGPENIGPGLKGQLSFHTSATPSTFDVRVQPTPVVPIRARSTVGKVPVTHAPSLLPHSPPPSLLPHSPPPSLLPHSPPLSPLPLTKTTHSSDVLRRRKWVDSVKADHIHSLAQHREAVERELKRLAECRENRFLAEDSRVRQLQNSVKNMSLLSDLSLDEEEEETGEEEEMAAMNDEQEQKVRCVLSQCSGMEVLSQKFNISIKRADIGTLSGLNWLNDEVINFYMNLIVERGQSAGSSCRVHAMSSFFYPKLCDGYSGVRRWTKKVDIFAMDLVLYPIHLGTHWCLAAINNNQHTLSYYDSLGGCGSTCLNVLRDYLVTEHRDKKKCELSLQDWSNVVPQDIPKQRNGSDCGVFTCMYARYLSSNCSFTFSQEDMPQIRRHIICELLEQRLF